MFAPEKVSVSFCCMCRLLN